MTQAQHTPGPWELVVKDDKYGKEVIVVGKSIGDESPVVCGCIMDPNYDGFLIAAGPEMKDLLEEIHHAEVFFQSACIARDFIDADKWEKARKEAFEKIPAVIAKARGESEAA